MKFISTEGSYLTAVVQIGDRKYCVMDDFSEDLNLKSGDSMAFKLSAEHFDEDSSWDSYFNSNPKKQKGLEQLAGWKYQVYGEIKSINPVVVDCDILQVNSPFFSNDPSIVGTYVGFVIERLSVNRNTIEFLDLVYEYIDLSKRALKYLKSELGEDFSGATAPKGHPHQLPDGSEYQFHGAGCLFTDNTGMEVDFDFALSGGKNGFDAWRLWSFAKQIPNKYANLQTLDAIENALKDAKSRSLVHLSKNSLDSLFYMTKDEK